MEKLLMWILLFFE